MITDHYKNPNHREGGGCGATITDLQVKKLEGGDDKNDDGDIDGLNNVLVYPDVCQIGDSGYIRSPNYPSAYPADIKCVWWLKAKSKGSQHLGLIFSQAFFILLIYQDAYP